MHRRGVVLGPTRAVVFPLPIAIILLVPTDADRRPCYGECQRKIYLVRLHAEPDLSTMLLINLKAYIAGGVIEASGNV